MLDLRHQLADLAFLLDADRAVDRLSFAPAVK